MKTIKYLSILKIILSLSIVISTAMIIYSIVYLYTTPINLSNYQAAEHYLKIETNTPNWIYILLLSVFTRILIIKP